MVERVQNDTEQVKKTQSAILSAPTTDESKIFLNKENWNMKTLLILHICLFKIFT